jgi:hypothetical protein
MKTKNKMKRGFKIALFLALILIPFAMSYDIDGDGIDDGEQMLCGDTFCQPGENETNCPTDCVSPSTPDSGDLTEIPPENESFPAETNETIPANEENLQTQTEESFFSTTTFRIIILVAGLILIGAIIFFLIKNKKNKEEENQIPAIETPTEQ